MKKTASKRAVRRPVVETLEPRILFSADFAPGLVDTTPLPVEAEQRSLGAGGEFAHSAEQQALARMHEEIDAAVEAFAPYRGSAAGQELLGLARQLAAAFETPAVGDDARVVSAG